MATAAAQVQFLRIKEVLKMVPVSRPTIYRLMEKGEFPKAIKVGSSSLWAEGEINEWLIDKVNSR